MFNKTRLIMKRTLFLIILIVKILCLPTLASSHEIITRISQTPEQFSGNGDSWSPAISNDGRYLAFHSSASNLVADDHNGFADIFVYDRQTTQIERISVANTGEEANFISMFASISGDGRYVAFQSDANNLVETEDTNGTADIFVYDRETHTTQLISIAPDGEPANNTSSEPNISEDGRYVVFHSYASNLVPKGTKDTNDSIDVFSYDLTTQEITCLSVTNKGKQGNGASYGAVISADNNYVAFSSEATNLVTGDTNKATDVFVQDRQTGEITRVSINNDGVQGDEDSFTPSLSADGRYVAFVSRASNLIVSGTSETNNNNTQAGENIFVHDRQTGETTLVSLGDDGSPANANAFSPTLSADGRYVVFNAEADNLVNDDTNGSTDVFIYDREAKTTRRLTLIGEGPKEPYTTFNRPALSKNGRWIAFESSAWNLVVDDFNEATDIFLYDLEYYASFDSTTGELYIPVLTVKDFGLFRASLLLIPDQTPIQLSLQRISSFEIPLVGDIASSYQVETNTLQLPKIEIVTPDQILQCTATLVTNSELTLFSATSIVCKNSGS